MERVVICNLYFEVKQKNVGTSIQIQTKRKSSIQFQVPL